MQSRMAWAMLSIVLSGTSPAANERPEPCERLRLGLISEEELVHRFGPPCSVSMPWNRHTNGNSASTLVYAAVCSIECPPPDDRFHFVFCHSGAPAEVLLGPLGPATEVRFYVRDGVVAFAEWE